MKTTPSTPSTTVVNATNGSKAPVPMLYGVVIPSLTKNEQIRGAGLIVLDISEIHSYPNRAAFGYMSAKSETYCDYTKKGKRYHKQQSFTRLSKYDRGNYTFNAEFRRWNGNLDVLIFESVAEAVRWKIDAVNAMTVYVQQVMEKRLATVKRQNEIITKSMKAVLETNPEYFL